jgi:hypothetical protein
MKKSTPCEKEIVFFIDKQKFKTEEAELTVRSLLEDYAEENPDETSLVLRDGNDLDKFTDLDLVIALTSGMKFLVYHNGPTPVSDVSYGPERFHQELADVGYIAERSNLQGQHFAVINDFEVPVGKFAGRVITLGIQIPPDYPQSVAAAIHVLASPQLFEKSDSVPDKRNITDSVLGPDWRYWSKRFSWRPGGKAKNLISKIYGVLENA